MFKRRRSQRPWMSRCSPLGLALVVTFLLAGACGDTTPEEDNPDTFTAKSPHEDLDSLVWEPQFEPDYNNLQPQPWVEVVTEAQARNVVVRPDTLIFPKADHPEVLLWEEGKVVVAAPSDGPGANPLGFARRVVSVTEVDDTLVVETEAVALQDIVTGEMQFTFDYSEVQTVDISKLDLDWAARHLYVDANIMSPRAEGNPDDEPLPEAEEEGDPALPGDPSWALSGTRSPRWEMHWAARPRRWLPRRWMSGRR